jgi:hypothetical protein
VPETTFALDLPPGIVSDNTTFSDTGQWSDGNNVRFRLGKPETIGGWSLLRAFGANIAEMLSFRFDGSFYTAYAGDTKLYVGAALAAPADCTPSPAPSSTPNWSLAAFGETLLAAPRLGSLYELPEADTPPATKVTQAPAQIVRMLVTPQRQVLAFGCNEEVSTTFNSLCIRGSDLETYTDWTTTSTNNAFETILDGGGQILDAALVGTNVAVLTSNGLYQGLYIGDPGQAYRFDRVDAAAGVFFTGCCVSHGGRLYWFGTDMNFYRWSPGALPEMITCPIIKDCIDNLAGFPTMGVLPAYDEIWLLYSDTRDGVSGFVRSRYIAFSISESALAQRLVWFRGQLARNSISRPGDLGFLLGGRAVLMGDNAGNVYKHDVSTSGPTTSFIQSADQYINSGRTRVMVRGVAPDFEQQSGDVSLTLYTKDRPQSTAVTKGPYTLTAGAAKKDFRASGMIVSMKLSASAKSWRLGKPVFDCVTTGGR